MLLLCPLPENIHRCSFKKLYELSEKERKEKADRIKNEEKKAVSLASGLLKRLLSEKYNFKYVSISHSHNIAAALGENVPCGVDVEFIREVKESLILRCCSSEEIKEINSSPDKNIKFIELWTKKEALFKAGVGENLYDLFKYNDNILKEIENYEIETEIHENFIITTAKRKPLA